MKPDIDVLLRNLGTHIARQVIPRIDDAYLGADLATIAKLLFGVAADFDHAASRLIEENGALRRLFTKAAPLVEAEGLRAELAAAADGSDADFRISSLDQSNASLRSLLIRVHEHVENLEGEQAAQLEASIWQELSASVQRRLAATLGISGASEVLGASDQS